ncbi:hypothetical protein QO239_08010 [Cupriavidus taiwanensis]|uniref:hypothetical protein n=1 Tax=Cupriavidus taiwanensis TaxID=164546 RepID=UPI000E2E922A|nr:hypothetical protein [Cupriavidus taiwanensis]MDK3022552.1 hypothetical protein [Cupriavidus taiwanensis]
MLPRRLPTTQAAMLIAAALLAACGGDGGPTLSPTATLAPSAQPVKPGQPGNKPGQRPDPVIRCAP